MTKKENSINYWSKRNPCQGFRTFLWCYNQRLDLPWLSKDIKKILYKYIAYHLQFNKLSKNRSPKIDTVNNISMTFPNNSLQCVGLTVCRINNNNNWRCKAIFRFNDDKIYALLMRLEKRLFDSVPQNVFIYPVKSIIDKCESGYTLFYSFTNWNGIYNSLPYKYPDKRYFSIDNIQIGKNRILTKGEWINYSIKLQICGIFNKKEDRRSRMSFILSSE